MIIPVITFILGFFVNFIYEHCKEKKRLEKFKKYFFSLVNSRIEPIDKQVSNLEKTSQEIEKQKTQSIEFKVETKLLIDILANLPRFDLYKVLVLKKRKNIKEKEVHFNVIFDTFDFIRQQNESFIENTHNYRNDLRKYEVLYIENANKIGRKLDDFNFINRKDNIPLNNDPFLKSFNMMLNNWLKKDMFIAVKNFIRPLKKLCNEYLNDERSIQLLPNIVGAEGAYNNMLELKKVYSNYVADEAKVLREKRELLEKAINFFTEMET